jgi:hypothetical protein
MSKKTPHYEIFHKDGNYKVVVYDSIEKHVVIAGNSYGSYNAARNYGRAWKAGKYRLNQPGDNK